MPFDNFGNYMPYNPYPQPQPKQPQNVYAFVNGLEGAKSYIVPANQTVLLMDSEQPVCYMKTANALGQGSLRYFKLTEVSEADVRGSTQNGINAQRAEEFVSKKEFNDLLKRIEKLEKPKEEV